MNRFLTIITALLWFGVGATGVLAQGFSGLAQVDASQSRITDRRGGVEVVLALSQGVPYRSYTLDAPRRLVLDFREVDWRGVMAEEILQSRRISAVRFGLVRPGWTRMVLDLSEPMRVQTTDLAIDRESGRAILQVVLIPSDADQFAALSVAPHDPTWDLPPAAILPDAVTARPGDGKLRILLDPGHGGIDPGAEREGAVEKDLMLILGRELKEELLRSGGFEVVMTREDDRFVSLKRRVAMAHEVRAHVFLSLHADALAEGGAKGATLHLLAETASDAASEKLAERHDRDDILAGVDLTGKDDEVAAILLDLARVETQPRSRALAKALADGLKEAGVPLNRKPIRWAGFSVLEAADIPSVLLEIGFLSNSRDRANLADPDWRRQAAVGIRAGLQAWLVEDAAVAALVRQ